MNTKEIHLEPIPGINLGGDEPPKETETKASLVQQTSTEINKPPPTSTSSVGKKDTGPIIDKITQKKLLNFSKRMLPKNKRYLRRNSTNLPLSLLFLRPFALIDDKDTIQEEDNILPSDEESSHHKKFTTYETSTDLDNTKKLFGYNSKSDRNPVKQGLLNRIDQLQRNQREIDLQFKYDSEIYLKRIQLLEKACNAECDEAKLKKLEKTSKENKELIKEYKKLIEQAEKEKIKDKKNFTANLNEIIELKSILLSELKELEILAKNTSFQDYDEYLKDNPTKIEKLNFRPNDSRYLLTNEYETSREEEESFSSYEKLNHINNTPDGFDINKQSNLSKTEQYFLNTKNFVGTGGSGNNNNTLNYNINNSFNVANKNRINNSFMINHDKNNNKEMEKFTLRKNETLNESKSKKSIIEMKKKDSKNKNSKPTVNFTNKNSKNNKNDNQNLRNKNQDNNSNKRRKPSEIIMGNIPQDPDFLDNEMILIRDMGRKEDTFY